MINSYVDVFRSERVFILNFNFAAFCVFIIRLILRKQTVVSIHDVKAHGGEKYLLTTAANLIVFKLASSICVYSNFSAELLKLKYKGRVIILPLDGFYYDY